MEREQYEKDLAERQKQHLENIKKVNNGNWRPCLHDLCPTCHGTGLDTFGRTCVHGISCPCPKCVPFY